MDLEAGCRGKQAYLSKSEAKRVARLMTARHADAFHLYDCPTCRYFHVGHLVPSFLRVPGGNVPAAAYGD